jgi:hypothetical protein
MQLEINNGLSFRTIEEEIDFHRIRIESLGLSTRTQNALLNASIRTIGGIVRKTESSLLDIQGLGISGIEEIKMKLNDPATLLLKEKYEPINIPILYERRTDIREIIPEDSFKKNNVISFKTKEEENDFYKTRVESLGLSTRTQNALINTSVRTVGGIMRKTESSLLEIPGLGLRGIKEIKNILNYPASIFIGQEQKSFPEISTKEPALENNILTGDVSNKFTAYQFNGKSNGIIKFFANYFGIDENLIKSETRKKEVVEVRDSIIYFLREYCDMSYPDIGRLFHRDHTTMIHSYRKIKDNIVNVENFASRFSVLIEELKSTKNKVSDIENKTIEKINPDILFKKLEIKFKDISDRSMKILELYREGKTLENIGKIIGVTRERVRQIVEKTIKQIAINDSISRGIIIDEDVVLEEEKKNRNFTQKRIVNVVSKPEKEKRWSRYYLACKSCRTTSIPHVRKGLCEQCIGGFRANRREEIIEQHYNKCDSCGRPRHDAITFYGRDFYITKDKNVFCRGCFLGKTGKELGSYKNYDWSRHHERCLKCGTTSILHKKNGLCIDCSNFITNKQREEIIIQHNNKCDTCGINRIEAKKNQGKDFCIVKNNEVLCRKCFQKYAMGIMRLAKVNKNLP